MRHLIGQSFGDIWRATALLSRLPVPAHRHVPERMAAATWAFPIVGLFLGGIAGGILAAIHWATGSPELAAGLALLSLVLMTGALHEDGLADCADGLGGGTTRERALEIMRDSRIGAYGAVSLILFMLLRWSALMVLAERNLLLGVLTLVAASALSRGSMALVMAMVPHARSDGLSKQVGRPDKATAIAATGIGLMPFLLLFQLQGLIPILISAALGAWLVWRAQRKIGGQTGDVLGGVQQFTELGALIGACALVVA